MLELVNISKKYGDRTVVDRVNLAAVAGQTHVLLGSSGSGKSTLLRIALGLVTPDEGEVRVDGEVLTKKNQRSWLRRIGYVPQEGGLFPVMTASENVKLVARTLGWENNRIEGRLEELRQTLTLEKNALDRFPNQLSGGQRQRVAIMRALFLDPNLIVLDESLTALDPIVRSEMQDELRSLFTRLHKTVLMVTHDINEASLFGHTVTLLRKGKVIQSGPFQELVESPADRFVVDFIRAQRQWSLDSKL